MHSSASNRTKSNTAKSIFTRLWACRSPYSDVPASFDGTARYEASLFGSESVLLEARSFSRRARKLDFPGVRMVYTNFALRAVLRALYAIEHRERDCFNGVFNRPS